MKVFKIIGAVLFLTGVGFLVYGTGGSVQYVPEKGVISHAMPGMEAALITGLLFAGVVAGLMFLLPGKNDFGGPIFFFAGIFALVIGLVNGLNQKLDNSSPKVRTLLVKNIDVNQSQRGTIYHYALVPSWWDRTRYIPLTISKQLYNKITPGETLLDVSVREGAFGYSYFSKIKISDKTTGRPLGMEDFQGLEEFE